MSQVGEPTTTPAADAFEEFDSMAQFVGGVAGDVRDPYPRLAKRRRAASAEVLTLPNFAGEKIDSCLVYTYDLVSQVMRDNHTFSSGSILELMGLVMGPYVLVGMDEPEHGRHRGLVSPAFRHKALARWEEQLVGGVVHELIDRFAGRGHAELVREFTFRFPVEVISSLLGIPRQDADQFHQWAVDIINVAARPKEGMAASASLRAYLAGIVDQRRQEPQEDLISDLVTTELDGERLGDEEVYSFLRLLLPAGAETTYRSTGNFLFGLLTHPEQYRAVRNDRSLMPAAVEESIRWEPPLLLTNRVATVDTEIGGVKVPAGMMVNAQVGAANHDETRWDHPDEFDIFRPPKPHISFGMGPHMCLGMHLARMEMRVAVSALFDRLEDLRLDPGDADPHIHGERFRSPTCLPVAFTPA